MRLITLLLSLWVLPLQAQQSCNVNIPEHTPSSRFTSHGNGTVTDGVTDRMWMRCSLGQTWTGSDCSGSAGFYNWSEALQAASNSSFASHGDWRLPNINELAGLVEIKCVSPAINLSVFPNTPSSGYWSGSPYAGNSGGAWNVSFDNGDDFTDFKSVGKHVRLVRGGQ